MRGVTTVYEVVEEYIQFQLTRLMRGVTQFYDSNPSTPTISTHTPHARRDLLTIEPYTAILISTHTPHARRDRRFLQFAGLLKYFNSHASCEA